MNVGEAQTLRINNGIGGRTWANEPNGDPIPSVKSNEDLYVYLKESYE